MTIEELRNINNATKSRHHASPEHQLQCRCVEWFNMQYPKLLLYATPNGGARNAITGAMLKREGVRAGIPDLFLAKQCKGFGGLYIEMKNGKVGKVSEEQKHIIAHLQSEGYMVEVVRDFDSFVKVINNYINCI